MPFYDANETEINEFEIEKPLAGMPQFHAVPARKASGSCKKDDDPSQEIPCQLTRMDQRDEAEFKCYAYEKKELLQ